MPLAIEGSGAIGLFAIRSPLRLDAIGLRHIALALVIRRCRLNQAIDRPQRDSFGLRCTREQADSIFAASRVVPNALDSAQC